MMHSANRLFLTIKGAQILSILSGCLVFSDHDFVNAMRWCFMKGYLDFLFAKIKYGPCSVIAMCTQMFL